MSTTMRKDDNGSDKANMFAGLIEALADKHSELDLNFQNVSLRMPGMQRVGIELNGTITLSVHMRDLTDDEKRALASKHVATATQG